MERSNFVTGNVQMFLVAANIRNMAGGHLVLVALFIFINTYVLRDVYRRAHRSGHKDWFIYTMGCVLGGLVGTVAQGWFVKLI
jgi:multisubunit Na+/H+ antiporter MnhG subunit